MQNELLVGDTLAGLERQKALGGKRAAGGTVTRGHWRQPGYFAHAHEFTATIR